MGFGPLFFLEFSLKNGLPIIGHVEACAKTAECGFLCRIQTMSRLARTLDQLRRNEREPDCHQGKRSARKQARNKAAE